MLFLNIICLTVASPPEIKRHFLQQSTTRCQQTARRPRRRAVRGAVHGNGRGAGRGVARHGGRGGVGGKGDEDWFGGGMEKDFRGGDANVTGRIQLWCGNRAAVHEGPEGLVRDR
jgi:hypothetical protein